MKFAKKTISVFLAAVMASSSLFASTTALAANKTFTPTAAQNQVLTVSDVVKSDKSPWAEKEEDKYKGDFTDYYSYWDSTSQKTIYCYYNEKNYFSFTPAETGTYAVSLSGTTDIYQNRYNNADGSVNYTYTTVPDSKAKVTLNKSTSVSVYDSADVDNNDSCIMNLNNRTFASAYKYDKEDNRIVADYTTAKTIYYDTAELQAGETYYIVAEAPAEVELPDSYQGEPNVKWIKTSPQLKIAKTDWSADIESSNSENKTVKIAVDTTENYVYSNDGELDVKTEANGSKYVEKKIYTPAASVYYTGKGSVVNVPSQIAGTDVKYLTGSGNKNITELNIPSGVDSAEGFSDFRKLVSVNLGTVKEIGSFSGCTSLKSISIPASVERIGSSAFNGCTSLSSVYLYGGLKSVGSYAFYNTALKSVNIPSSVTTIGDYAFGAYEGLDENTVEPNDTTTLISSDFVIVGTYSSAAHKYALQNGIKFYDASACESGNHPYTLASAKAATLFADGKKTYVCPVCGAKKTSAVAKAKLKIKSAKASKKAVTVKTSKYAEVKGYQIQVSTSKKFTKKTTKTVKVKTSKALSKKVTGLKSKKKYYVRVRAYKTSGKKTVYSKYSAVKSVKVK